MLHVVRGAYTRYHRIGKFAVSGGVSAVISLAVFITLTEVFSVWYLGASISAYAVSFFINFFMQKTWTFRNKEGVVHMQMGLFFVNSLFNLFLNTFLMYRMVDILKIHHIVAQVLVIGLLAVMNYTMYRLYIFRAPESASNIIDTL
jgi:putative flippase GtrA